MASAEEVAKALKGIIGANDEEATVKDFLDTGFPPLNMALSGQWDGGLPVGRVVEISGPPSAGKTAIATRAMAAAQKRTGIAAFMDHERSFSVTLAPKLGLDVKPGRFVYKKPETLEESFALMRGAARTIREKELIPANAPIAWVFDSLAAMVPRSLLYDSKGKPLDPSERNMKDRLALATAASEQLPIVAQTAEDYGVLVIILNQLRTKPNVQYGDPIYTPGGDAKEFYYSVRLRLSAAKIKASTEANAEIIGMLVTGKTTKNKVTRPFLKADWRFMFHKDGTGHFDVERSLVEFLNDAGFIEKGKPGYVVHNGKSWSREQLARDIEARGALDELKALLPPAYEPPAVAVVEEEEEEAA